MNGGTELLETEGEVVGIWKMKMMVTEDSLEFFDQQHR